MKRSALIAAVMLAGAACSGGSGPVSDPKPVDPGVATVTFSVAFPSRSGAVKTLLDPLTNTVEISWYTLSGMQMGNTSVTRAAPSTTVTVPVGNYYFQATALDDTMTPLETAGTVGRLIAGENSLVMTFLDGEWRLGTPIELSDGTVLNGFFLSYLLNDGPVGPVALDPNSPSLQSIYNVEWILNEATAPFYAQTQARIGTQFGGGIANRNYFDGAGFNLTSGCGEYYYGDGQNVPPACQNGGGPGAGVNFRIIGDLKTGGGGDQATSALLPEGSFDPPSVYQYVDSVVTDGVTISGHVLEYTPTATQPTPIIVTGQTAAVSAAPVAKAVQSTPDSSGTLTVSEYRSVILCRDDYNRVDAGTTVELGTWDFHDWDCPQGGGPCTIRRDCAVDFNNDGVMDYAECGSANPPGLMAPVDPGECNWGLIPANPSDLGEWCECWDRDMNTCYGNYPTCGDGVVAPWEFNDINGDGFVDTGSFFFEHYVQSGFQLDYFSYPFTATGTAVAPTMQITVR